MLLSVPFRIAPRGVRDRSGDRWASVARRGARLASALGLLTLVACGNGSSSPATDLLPDGPGDPRAFTESFLAAQPNVTLRLSHLAILHLEPTTGPEDTGDAPGTDAVPYVVSSPGTLTLAIDASAHQVSRLRLRNRSGTELALLDSGSLTVEVPAGSYVLEVDHVRAGDSSATPQTVFLRPHASGGEGAGGWELRASANCENCSFDNSTIQNHSFDGVDLSGSTFQSSFIDDSTFRNASMVGCDFSGSAENLTGIRGSDFTGANLTMARFDQAGIFETAFGGSGAASGATLDGASFGRIEDGLPLWSELGTVDFRNASLVGVTFVTPFSGGSHFEGADLSNATFAVAEEAATTPTCTPCTFGVEPESGRVTSFAGAVLGAKGSVSLELSAGTSLAGVDFTGAQFVDGSFTGLNFAGGLFAQADLSGATLDGSVFDGARFAGAVLTGASARDSSLIGAHLEATGSGSTMLPAAVLNSIDLEGANAYTANLQGVSLTGASLIGANLNYTDLSGAAMSGAQLGVPENSSQSAATLVGAYMPNVDLEDADLRGVDLSHAHIYGDTQQVNLSGALLDGADLTGAVCSGSAFTNASLTNAIFNDAQLVNTTFSGADLTRAILSSSYLQGADFSGAASVEGARLDNAAVATMAGVWTFTDQNGMPVNYPFGATVLGAFASDPSVTCPDAQDGPCTSNTLNPVDDGPFPPVPTCVPQPPNYNNCTRPQPPATPTPTP